MTLCSAWWILQALAAACFVLVGSTMLVYEAGDPVATGIGLAVLLPFASVLVRAPFQRVRVDEQGVAQHGFTRTTYFAWSDIAGVQLERIDERLEVGVYTPTLLLTDGQVRPLKLLAGYSTSRRAVHTRMARQVALIEQIRPS